MITAAIPAIGISTFKLFDDSYQPVDKGENFYQELIYNVLDAALSVGYRLIDVAMYYQEDIGNALTRLYGKHNLSRSDLFIQSKISARDMGYEAAIASCLKTIAQLKCSYIDLLVIIWPGKSKLKPCDSLHQEYRLNTWRALEDLKSKGLVRHIGVANFTLHHLVELLEYAKIKPSVNQIEFHLHHHQCELVNFCREKGIYLQSYTAIGAAGTGALLNDETVLAMAEKYNRNSAAILLKWVLQNGVGILPKSANCDHIRSNFKVTSFEITKEDMEILTQVNKNKLYYWNPSQIK